MRFSGDDQVLKIPLTTTPRGGALVVIFSSKDFP